MTQSLRHAVAPGTHVLVVDDNALVRRLLGDALVAAGYLVDEAADGAGALAAVQRQPPVVAVVDLVLPGDMGGITVLQQIHALCPETAVLIITASPSIDSAIDALRLGAHDYLQKPLSIELTIEKVARAAARVALEAENRLIRRNYEVLFETVPGVVWFMTKEGVFRHFSEEGAAALGYEVSDLVGQLYTLLAPRTIKVGGDVQWVFKERRTGKRATRRRQVELRTKSGAVRRFEITSSGAYDHAADGGASTLGTFGVGWDVTEQAQLEGQLLHAQRLDAMGRLAAGIAHDFNNLLSVINVNTRLLRSRLDADAEAGEIVSDVLQAGDQAAALTRQLLCFSQQLPIDLAVVPAGELVTSIAKLLRRVIGPPTELRVDVTQADACIKVDANQLQQVLLNLVINARDAMPAGGTIDLTVKRLDDVDPAITDLASLQPGRTLEIGVRDTGTGIPDEIRDRIFDPFFTTKGPERGTGLGLAVAYGIVKQHGGHIVVESTPGQGSTFRVLLPLAEPKVREQQTPTYGSLRRGGGNILLCEDEVLVRRSIKRALEAHGYVVVETADGREALAAAEELHDSLDLVITDVVLPHLDGIELASRLALRGSSVRWLFISGYPDAERRVRELGGGPFSFLRKPIRLGTFMDTVRATLARPRVGPPPAPTTAVTS